MNYTTVDFSFVRDLSIIGMSLYLTFATLVYCIKKKEENLNKENFIVFLCSLCTFLFSIVYFLFDSQFKAFESSKIVCDVAFTFWKTFLILNRCLCNLIFSYRYESLNRSTAILAAKRSFAFTITLIFVSLLLLVFDVVYYQLQISPSVDDCENITIDYDKHYISINIESGLFLTAVTLQTAILVEIIKPIYKHCKRLDNSTISNGSIRKTLYRVVVCTLVFFISDLGFGFAYLLGINKVDQRWTFLWALNLLVNTVSLMCSFNDYKTRIYPFVELLCNRRNSGVVGPVNQSANTSSTLERSNQNNSN